MLLLLRMVTLVIVAGMFILFITLLRRQKLELKYCLIWLVALLAIAALCIFPNLLYRLANLLGIETPVFALFLVCIAFLACVCISLTVVVSSLSNMLRVLTQKMAIMEYDVKKNTEESSTEERSKDISHTVI